MYKTYEDLPLTLNAEDVADVLNLSRSKAYELLHCTNFPSIRVGKRLIVPRDKFLAWLDAQTRRGQ